MGSFVTMKRIRVCSAPDDSLPSQYAACDQDRHGTAARQPLNHTPLRQAERKFKRKQGEGHCCSHPSVDVDLSCDLKQHPELELLVDQFCFDFDRCFGEEASRSTRSFTTF